MGTVEAASASKTNYDSKCNYSIKLVSKTVNLNIYFAKGKDAFLEYDETSGISPQKMKEINTDSSIDCPQLKICQTSSGYFLYPSSNYICPVDTGAEEAISSNGERQYSSSYSGNKAKKVNPCTTTYTIDNIYMGNLTGKKLEINLYPAEQSSKRKMEVILDGVKYEDIRSNPSVSFSASSKNINVTFENGEADTIYKTLNESGTCSFNIRQSGDNNNLFVLHLTTKKVESQDSITGKTEKSVKEKDQDISELYDSSWSREEGCVGLENSQTIKILRQILDYLRIAAVALLLVLGSLDFAGAVTSDKDDAMKQAGNKFIKRLLATVVVFLVPVLVNIILFIADKSETVCGILG